MRLIILVLFTFFFSSCFSPGSDFNKEYYEKVTGIKFPGGYIVLETFDNGEFLTGTVMQIDNPMLKQFITDNHFKPVQSQFELNLLSNNLLKQHKAVFRSIDNLYCLGGSKGKNNWRYIADLNTNRLWTEIDYPDWGGN